MKKGQLVAVSVAIVVLVSCTRETSVAGSVTIPASSALSTPSQTPIEADDDSSAEKNYFSGSVRLFGKVVKSVAENEIVLQWSDTQGVQHSILIKKTTSTGQDSRSLFEVWESGELKLGQVQRLEMLSPDYAAILHRSSILGNATGLTELYRFQPQFQKVDTMFSAARTILKTSKVVDASSDWHESVDLFSVREGGVIELLGFNLDKTDDPPALIVSELGMVGWTSSSKIATAQRDISNPNFPDVISSVFPNTAGVPGGINLFVDKSIQIDTQKDSAAESSTSFTANGMTLEFSKSKTEYKGYATNLLIGGELQIRMFGAAVVPGNGFAYLYEAIFERNSMIPSSKYVVRRIKLAADLRETSQPFYRIKSFKAGGEFLVSPVLDGFPNYKTSEPVTALTSFNSDAAKIDLQSGQAVEFLGLTNFGRGTKQVYAVCLVGGVPLYLDANYDLGGVYLPFK